MDVCYTCLSRDRILLPLSKFEGFLTELKMINTKYITGNICWECHHIMEKFTKFKKQVLKAHKLLKMQKLIELTSLSSLSVETKQYYDAEYYYTPDPLTNLVTSLKIEEDTIKQEITESDHEKLDFDNDFDQKPEITNDIYVEPLEETVNQIKKKSVTVNSDELKEKFITIVYTEEEMLKKREEKQNQPNFKKIPFKCNLCVLGFTKKDTYEEHLLKKHSESIGPLKCDVCHTRFASDKAVARHRSQHYICYRCKFCPYITSQLWSAVNHCRVKHGADTSGSVHCGQCDLVASTPEDLAEHVRTKHSLHCNECGEKFKGKNTLRAHKIRIHGVKREFKCDVCSKTFNSRTRLESHMARHSAALATRLSYCAHCKVQYNSVYVYRNHLRNSAHHANTTYPCTECNKKFTSKVYWRKHYNFYHLHKSKYKCEVCNKLFISNWRLKNHKQKHHGLSRTRDHACNVCGKKFYTLSTLRGHELTHSEQRLYMCEDCGDTFKQRPALYTHHRLVHRAKKTS